MKTNKKIIVSALFLSFLLSGTAAIAQKNQAVKSLPGKSDNQTTGRNYVDANHDGICDNKPTNCRRSGKQLQAGSRRGAGKCGYGRQTQNGRPPFKQ